MTAATTVPGLEARALLKHLPPPRVATPWSRRTSPTTFRRRRIVAAVLAAGVVVVAGQAGGALGGSPLAAPERRPTAPSLQTVVVQPGDTLWSIAKRLVPGEDPRPIVDELASAHGSGPLLPGQVLHWAR
jgi:LysM domain